MRDNFIQSENGNYICAVFGVFFCLVDILDIFANFVIFANFAANSYLAFVTGKLYGIVRNAVENVRKCENNWNDHFNKHIVWWYHGFYRAL